MKGSTSNGLLTYESAETASVESNITYNGSTQILANNGQINTYSGSYTAGQEPAIGPTSGFKVTSLLSPDSAVYHYTGSQNSIMSVVGRHTSFGSNSNCGATLAITSQVGNSSKNASAQLTVIGKSNNCHDAIFIIGVRCDAGSGCIESFINEMARFDAADHQITLTGSLVLDPTHVSTSASLGSILVYDNITGEIKRSTLTPPSSNSVTSVNGQTGVVTLSIPTNNNQLTNGAGYITSASGSGGASGNVQYNSGTNCGFAGESSFTYNETSNTLSVTNITASQLGLTTGYHLKYDGSEVIMNEGLADTGYIIFGNSGNSSVSVGDNVIDISGGEDVYITATNVCLGGKVSSNNLTTTTATDCNILYISSSGEFLEGPAGGGGGTPAGIASSIQFANATVDGFDGEGDFTYNKTTNLMNVHNIQTRCIQGDGNNVIITDGDNDACVFMCSFGTEKTIFGECDVSIGEASNTAASVINRAKVKIPDGTSSKPGIAFTNDPNMGLYRSGTSAILTLDDTSAAAVYEFQTDGLKISDGALAVGNISPSTTTGRIDASNDIVAYSTSDCRLKKYVKPIKNALDKIDQIRGVEFDWKVTDDKIAKEVHSFEGHDVGVLAQEIEAVLPEVVTTRDSGYKAVKYEKIVPLLIQGIKELKDEVEILKSKI